VHSGEKWVTEKITLRTGINAISAKEGVLEFITRCCGGGGGCGCWFALA